MVVEVGSMVLARRGMRIFVLARCMDGHRQPTSGRRRMAGKKHLGTEDIEAGSRGQDRIDVGITNGSGIWV